MEISKTYTTKELSGTRVIGGKKGTKRIGKVRHFVFHPTQRRVLGFLVKRPDLLLMFRRKDLFVPLDGFEWEDGRIVLPYSKDKKASTGPAVCKQLGVEWDKCTMWEGMPILTEDGEPFGRVGTIEFMKSSGKVVSITADQGAMDKALLGALQIPVTMIKGFRLGLGDTVVTNGMESEDDDVQTGAILVSNDVRDLKVEGGLADKAGKQAAIAKHQWHQTKEAAKPAMKKAADTAEDLSVKGAYFTGQQVSKTKTMFSDFKKEYDKGLKGEGDSGED